MFWTTEMCHAVMTAACEKAKEMKIRGVSLAIYERHGLEMMFHRMGCASVLSGKLAKAKAYTSALVGKPTEDLAACSSKEKGDLPAFQCMDPKFTLVKGGYPVVWNDRLCGGIGIAGGTPEQDCELCKFLVDKVMDYCKTNPPEKKCGTK